MRRIWIALVLATVVASTAACVPGGRVGEFAVALRQASSSAISVADGLQAWRDDRLPTTTVQVLIADMGKSTVSAYGTLVDLETGSPEHAELGIRARRLSQEAVAGITRAGRLTAGRREAVAVPACIERLRAVGQELADAADDPLAADTGS